MKIVIMTTPFGGRSSYMEKVSLLIIQTVIEDLKKSKRTIQAAESLRMASDVLFSRRSSGTLQVFHPHRC